MKAIILAAGYATRLYPLTLRQPKPLLPVAGKPMIDYLLSNVASVSGLDHVMVVTNAKFAAAFQAWADARRRYPLPFALSVENDGSTDEANKLGAIGDLHWALTRLRLDDDLVVVAGDNLFNESLDGFARFCRETNAPVLAVYDVKSFEEVRKHSVVSIGEGNQITHFEEKPQSPASTLAGIALYFYPKAALHFIQQYVAEGNNPDQPGRFVQWLYRRTPVYTWPLHGVWLDIGSKESLAEANRIFANAVRTSTSSPP